MYPTTSPAKNMILGQILTNDVLDTRILDVLNSVPREHFLPDHLKSCAYVDEELNLGNGRYLLEPLTFARMLQLAEIKPESRVLTVGCLSGYSAVVLSHLAGHVVAIDTDASYIEQAKQHIRELGLKNVDAQQVKSHADGYAMSAPYDVILINGAIDFVPEDLGTQLSIHGRLIAVHRKTVRPGLKMGLGRLLMVKRINNQLHYRESYEASTALLTGFEREEMFHF